LRTRPAEEIKKTLPAVGRDSRLVIDECVEEAIMKERDREETERRQREETE
jgi:hypothetical protein